MTKPTTERRAYMQSMIFAEIQNRQKTGRCRLLNVIEYTRDHIDVLDYVAFTIPRAVELILEEYTAFLDAKQ